MSTTPVTNFTGGAITLRTNDTFVNGVYTPSVQFTLSGPQNAPGKAPTIFNTNPNYGFEQANIAGPVYAVQCQLPTQSNITQVDSGLWNLWKSQNPNHPLLANGSIVG